MFGGGANSGTIFEATPEGIVTTLFDFSATPELIEPVSFVRAPDGVFYGICGGGTIMPPAVFRYDGGNAFSIHQFIDEEAPLSLIASSDGFLYGTTATTIFQLSAAGNLTLLYSFHQTYGGEPRLLLEGSDGCFYGSQGMPRPTIFRVSSSGDFSFLTSTSLGFETYADMVEDEAGNLIVTASLSAEVLRVTKTGEMTVLHKFFQPTEGAGPTRIIRTQDGNFCGVTTLDGEEGIGTLYELAPDGGFSVIHQFDQAADGGPANALLQHPNGKLYGLTQFGPGVDRGSYFVDTTAESLPTPTLLNISSRAQVGDGDDRLICGFIITGDTPEKVLFRALGPSLTSAGLSAVLADPILELHEPDGTILTNDNWKDSQRGEIEATAIPPPHDQEAAIVATLAPGAYTAVIRGQNNGTGMALVEAYDLDESTGSRLVNVSSRGLVGSGDDVLIDGIISGAGNVRVLIRALGPELAARNISGALLDPMLCLYDRDGAVVAANDNWNETQQVEIEGTMISPTDDREAAIVANLGAGNYTVVVNGKDGITGVALVEVYNLGL
jgi:uncharacterized repeat protein (TIGR03803 family)